MHDERIYWRTLNVRSWTEIPAVFADRRCLERFVERLSAVRSGQQQGQVEGRLLLAEGLHLRVSDGNRRLRQAEPRVRGPRRRAVRREHRLRVRALGMAQGQGRVA